MYLKVIILALFPWSRVAVTNYMYETRQYEKGGTCVSDTRVEASGSHFGNTKWKELYLLLTSIIHLVL